MAQQYKFGFYFQHSLVTEIRELVYPEDRTKYDELVYRRDTYLTDRDRHRVSFDVSQLESVFYLSFSFSCKFCFMESLVLNSYR